MVKNRTIDDPASILITTYPEAFLVPGGGEVELVGLAPHLRSMGVDADVYGYTSRPLTSYDAVLHFSIQESGRGLLSAVIRNNIPIYLWPNQWWSDEPSKESLINAGWFFSMAHKIVFKTQAEYNNVRKYMSVPDKKVIILPWGVNPIFADKDVQPVFKSLYRLGDYILWVGIIEERKNQLTAIRALKDIEIPIIFIGNHRDDEYYLMCKREAPSHFRFLPFMQTSSLILASAFRYCKVYVECSQEPAGSSALEAAASKRPLVLSRDPWSEELFGKTAFLVDPTSCIEIRDAVLIAQTETRVDHHLKNYLLPESLKGFVDILAADLNKKVV
jgi:glycosyltransferase involved in cell wall biosynthesis